MTVLYTSRISVLGNLQISESFVKCSSLSFVSVRDYLTERGLPFSSVVQSCPTLCDPVDCSTPGLPVHHHPGAYSNSCPLSRWCIQPAHPLLSPSPLTFNLSQHQGLFQWVSSSHQVAKVLEFQLQHQSFQWTFRIDFLMMDWLDLLAVHRTLKSLPQHHSSKASIFQQSAFTIVQLSYPYMTTGKTIASTIQTFVGKMMSLLFAVGSRLVIAFFQGSSVS